MICDLSEKHIIHIVVYKDELLKNKKSILKKVLIFNRSHNIKFVIFYIELFIPDMKHQFKKIDDFFSVIYDRICSYIFF